tara:strand:+ start:74 stop:1120 length:1047 start_codon:yes stop_codon:yes gene_type:complete
MIIENDIKLDFKDVLIRPKRSVLKSRSDVNLNREFIFKHNPNYQWKGVPIMVSNMDTTGTFQMVKEISQHNIFTCIHKHYSVDQWKGFRDSIENDYIYNLFSVTCGIRDEDILKLHEIMIELPKINFISLDVANGYSENFVNIVKQIRKVYPDKVIIAGAVVTREMTEELLLNGADIIRVGIGSGSVCTTRKKTGVGYPQLSAIIECADAAHGLNGHIISDGGCTCAGDFGKAFGAGSDFVMSGGMFAGHKESGGKVIKKNNEELIEFYGMSSSTAMEKYSGGVANYRTSEGKKVLLKYKGPVQNTVFDILGGLRSTCTYVGAPKLKDISKCTTFIRVTQQLNEIYGS